MTFVKLSGQHGWWEWDRDRMRLYNYDCGHTDIDENSDEWMGATLLEADDWHDLFVKTGYCPLYAPIWKNDLWVDIDGRTYEGMAHEVCAEDIGEILWGRDDVDGDELIRLGWIKLTTSGMLTYYIDYGMYDHITMEQEDVIRRWAADHGVKEFDNERWA